MTDTATPKAVGAIPAGAGAPTPAPARSYAKLAADESREDHSLRCAPHSFRRWSPATVVGTALGGIAWPSAGPVLMPVPTVRAAAPEAG
ncbi:hypothetical protein ACFU98_25800 [Streptomyces sp. NPDC057575]|uniref:hypothetical protein n=1 Tax=Streptomyces sp. NPDC057575 TaxID=3346170 RepID=UPI003688670E